MHTSGRTVAVAATAATSEIGKNIISACRDEQKNKTDTLPPRSTPRPRGSVRARRRQRPGPLPPRPSAPAPPFSQARGGSSVSWGACEHREGRRRGFRWSVFGDLRGTLGKGTLAVRSNVSDAFWSHTQKEGIHHFDHRPWSCVPSEDIPKSAPHNAESGAKIKIKEQKQKQKKEGSVGKLWSCWRFREGDHRLLSHSAEACSTRR